eukprot:snap_masked-scaffold140_size315649-processed-gene-2.6 protein:Tk03582 transcript:snap_masked-scaffold140_size315649-processed-gene-2.6-mRNA-1 annotation:"enhancing lycopene biosynthesis protein 2"
MGENHMWADLKAFSGDNFDAKDWINQTFKQTEALSNKEMLSDVVRSLDRDRLQGRPMDDISLSSKMAPKAMEIEALPKKASVKTSHSSFGGTAGN